MSRVTGLAVALCLMLPATIIASTAPSTPHAEPPAKPQSSNFGKFVILSIPVTWQEYKKACHDNGYEPAIVSQTTDLPIVKQALNSVPDKTVWVHGVYEEGGHLERYDEECVHYSLDKNGECQLVTEHSTHNNPFIPRHPLYMILEIVPVPEDDDGDEEEQPVDDQQSPFAFVDIPLFGKQPPSVVPPLPVFQDVPVNFVFGRTFEPLVKKTNDEKNDTDVDTKTGKKTATDTDTKTDTSKTPQTQFAAVSITCKTTTDQNGKQCRQCTSELIFSGSDLPQQSSSDSDSSSSYSHYARKQQRVPVGRRRDEEDEEQKREKEKVLQAVSAVFTDASWTVPVDDSGDDDDVVVVGRKDHQPTLFFTDIVIAKKDPNVPKTKKTVKEVNFSGKTNPLAKAENAAFQPSSSSSTSSSAEGNKTVKILSVTNKGVTELEWVDLTSVQRKPTDNLKADEEEDEYVIKYKPKPVADNVSEPVGQPVKPPVSEPKETLVKDTEPKETPVKETETENTDDTIIEEDDVPSEPTGADNQPPPVILSTVPKAVDPPGNDHVVQPAESEALATSSLAYSLIDSTMIISMETVRVDAEAQPISMGELDNDGSGGISSVDAAATTTTSADDEVEGKEGEESEESLD